MFHLSLLTHELPTFIRLFGPEPFSFLLFLPAYTHDNTQREDCIIAQGFLDKWLLIRQLVVGFVCNKHIQLDATNLYDKVFCMHSHICVKETTGRLLMQTSWLL